MIAPNTRPMKNWRYSERGRQFSDQSDMSDTSVQSPYSFVPFNRHPPNTNGVLPNLISVISALFAVTARGHPVEMSRSGLDVLPAACPCLHTMARKLRLEYPALAERLHLGSPRERGLISTNS